MKHMKAFRILVTVLALGVVMSYSGCKKSSTSEPTQQKQLALLTQTWKISTVSLGGVDQTASWKGFTLTISGTYTSTTGTYNYTCASRPALSPWPASGTWTFGTDPITQITRTEDSLNMTYTATATTLQITFNYTGTGYSRVSNVAGNWIFNFTK